MNANEAILKVMQRTNYAQLVIRMKTAIVTGDSHNARRLAVEVASASRRLSA